MVGLEVGGWRRGSWEVRDMRESWEDWGVGDGWNVGKGYVHLGELAGKWCSMGTHAETLMQHGKPLDTIGSTSA